MEDTIERNKKIGNLLVHIEPYILNENHMKKIEEHMEKLYEKIILNQDTEDKKKTNITKPLSPTHNPHKEPPLCDMV